MSMNYLSMVLEATLLSQMVLGFLLLMSVASWTVIFMKYFSLRSASSKAKKGVERFEEAKGLREAVQELGADMASPLYAVAQLGVNEFNRSREANMDIEMIIENVERSLDQGVSLALADLNKSMSFLATCSNTAPFIGLFGTVWGIMYSFHSIGLMRSASLATVAPGISEALIATAVGLFVAIPASMAYNSFSGMIGGVETRLSHFAAVFINSVQRELGKK